jgi:hypothetical protein
MGAHSWLALTISDENPSMYADLSAVAESVDSAEEMSGRIGVVKDTDI